jgi:small subunit ribosomal protein S8
MTKYTVGEIVTSIRNAVRVKKPGVKIPKTRVTQILSNVLLQEKIIRDISDSFTYSKKKNRKSFLYLSLNYHAYSKQSVITDLQCVSRPGLRTYTNHKEIPQVLSGFGLVLLSTPHGIITDRDARVRGVGGEVLFSLW